MQFAKQIKGNLLSPVTDVMFRENEKSCTLIPVELSVIVSVWALGVLCGLMNKKFNKFNEN